MIMIIIGVLSREFDGLLKSLSVGLSEKCLNEILKNRSLTL